MLEAIVIIILGSFGITMVLFCFLHTRLKTCLLPKQGPNSLSDWLPFLGVDDKVTLANKNHSYARTLEVSGIDTSTITTNEYESFVAKRHNMLLDLAKQNSVLKMLTIREIVATRTDPTKFANPTLQHIANLSLQNMVTFENRHYLSTVVLPKKGEIKDWILDRLQGKTTDAQINLSRLTENCDLISETLPNSVTLLSTENKDKHLLKFWAKVVSGVDLPPVAPEHRIDKWLSNSRIDFDYIQGLITQTTGDKVRYGKIVSLNEWGETSSGEILQQIISLPYEMICLQLLSGKDKTKSKNFVTEEKRYRKSNKAQEELNAVETLIDNEEALLFEHQLSIFVFANTTTELEEAISRVRQVFRFYELIAIVETTAIKQIYLQLFPGNETKLRTTHLLSSNVAHMLNFHTDSPGVLSSDWADFPIASFKTAAGIYGFSFHREPGKEQPANSLVVAPTGAGKTILLMYLVAMSLRVQNLQAFVFDRHYGCKIAAHALGGEHIDLTGQNSPINIFCCEETIANKLFISNFLLQLAGFSHGDEESNMHKNLLRQAVNMMFSLPKEERFFSDFYDELIPKAHPLYQRLYAWGKGEFSHWLSGYRLVDGKRQAFDALQFGNSKLVVFEMTTILESPELVILVEYIMHRIFTQTSGKGIPHLIAIDETAQMVKNPVVKHRLSSILQEIRKSRGGAIVCFQNPSSIFEDEKLADIILNNCPNQILFPNPRAESTSYAPFKLCDREWQFVLGQHRAKQRLKRPILVRKDREKEGMQSAIIDVDLSHLGKYFNLIRSGGEFVEIFNRLYNKGELEWVEKYLEATQGKN